jgi:hypothetical protein
MADVEASFEFLQWQPSYEIQKPYEVFLPLASFGKTKIPRSNLVFEPHTVRVQDARACYKDYELDTHGFQFLQHATAVRDLKDRASVNDHYIPEMEAFLRRHLQEMDGEMETRAFCFDLRVRHTGNSSIPLP